MLTEPTTALQEKIASGEVATKTKKIAYAIQSCARCGQPVERGDTVELWLDGPKFGRNLRWVHVGCGCPATTTTPVAVPTADVNTLIADAFSKIDFSSLDSQLDAAVAKHLAGQDEKIVKTLGEFTKQMADAAGEQSTTLLNEVARMIDEGIPRVVTVQRWDGSKLKLDGNVHPAFEEVLATLSLGENSLMVGPAGCGKSTIAEQCAKALGLQFGFLNCSGGMSESHIFGKTIVGASGAFEYAMSDFIRCYEQGGVFLIDEIDAADPNVLISFNNALASGRCAVPARADKPYAERHPDFICIAAANTFGKGADRQYSGRNALDEATLDRFRLGMIEVDYDPTLEKSIAKQVAGETGLELLTEIVSIRDKVANARLRRVVSTRFIAQAMKAKAAGWDNAKILGRLTAGWTRDELTKVGL